MRHAAALLLAFAAGSAEATSQPSTCMLPFGQAGLCRALVPKWSFSQQAGECQQFNWGGCAGAPANANRFDSQAACARECGGAQTAPPIPIIMDGSPCRIPGVCLPCTADRCGQNCFSNGVSGVCQVNNVCAVNIMPPNCPQQCTGRNERFVNCGACDASCDNLMPMCPALCKLPGDCGCIDGHVRNSNNACIPKTECPAVATVAPTEPMIADGTPICVRAPSLCAPCTAARCGQTCFTSNGVSGVCQVNNVCANNMVPPQCPQQCTGRNERFVNCGACDASCDNLMPICPTICKIPGDCGCIEGHVRNSNNVCIPKTECPRTEAPTVATVAPTDAPDYCSLPAETGLCRAHMPMWYYNGEEDACQQFIYGGCGGNANRFPTEAECGAATANLECDVCGLEFGEVGRCRAAFRKWSYDSATNTCREFVWGGCGGNKNRFDSKADCEASGCIAAVPGTFWTRCTKPSPKVRGCNKKGWCKVQDVDECRALKAGNCNGEDCAGAIFRSDRRVGKRNCRLCQTVSGQTTRPPAFVALAAAKETEQRADGAPSAGLIAGIAGGAAAAIAAAVAACVVVARRRGGAEQQDLAGAEDKYTNADV